MKLVPKGLTLITLICDNQCIYLKWMCKLYLIPVSTICTLLPFRPSLWSNNHHLILIIYSYSKIIFYSILLFMKSWIFFNSHFIRMVSLMFQIYLSRKFKSKSRMQLENKGFVPFDIFILNKRKKCQLPIKMERVKSDLNPLLDGTFWIWRI